MKNFYNIQYIPTGMIFNVEKEECDRLIREESVNFRMVDDDYIPPKEEAPETTIQELVMGKEQEEPETNITESVLEEVVEEEKPKAKKSTAKKPKAKK